MLHARRTVIFALLVLLAGCAQPQLSGGDWGPKPTVVTGTGCATATSTAIQKGNGSNGCADAVSGTDFTPANVLVSHGGSAPTITAGCTAGGGNAVAGTNYAGQITTGATAATTCTMTFSATNPFSVAPYCVFTDANASTTPVAYSAGAVGTTTAVIDFASASSKKINYVCVGG